MILTNSVQSEYWFHVADQSEIPIAGKVDNKSIDLDLLSKVAKSIPINQNLCLDYIKQLILKNPDAIDMLRTLVGVSDKRMYLELSYLYSKTRYNKNDTNNILSYSIYDLNKKTLKFFKSTLSSTNSRSCPT